jgi:NADPH:quinone reductase-like Zn-dependent oxidoreductase
VRDLKPGDRVSSIPAFSMRQYGAYGDSVVLPANALSVFPDRLSYEQGAAIWMQYGTAFGLIEFGKMHTGQFVLITAAASSVGLAAIQIARAVGASTIATTRNPDKEQTLKKLGANFVVNSKEKGWVDRVREITEGRGVDIAFDPVVGPAFEDVIKCVRAAGTTFIYGALSQQPTPLPVGAVIGNHLTICGYTLFQITRDPERLARVKKWIVDRLNERTLDPVIAKVFPFDQIVESHRYLESSEQIGKIIVTVP